MLSTLISLVLTGQRNLSSWQTPVPPLTTKLTPLVIRYVSYINPKVSWYHWRRDKMVVLLQTTVSIIISCIKIFVVWYKLHKKMFRWFQLVTSYSFGSDNGLAPKRRQAIIWTNDNTVDRHIYVPAGFLLVLLADMHRTGLCKLIVSDTNMPLPLGYHDVIMGTLASQNRLFTPAFVQTQMKDIVSLQYWC